MNFLDKLFFAYRAIRSGSSSLPVRSATRYSGGVTVADDPDNDETVVTIDGGSGGGGIAILNDGVPLGTFTSLNLGGLTALDSGGGVGGIIPGPIRLLQIINSGTQTYGVARDNMFLLQNANMAFVIDPPGAPFFDVPDGTLVVFVMRVAPGTVTIAFSGGTVENSATYPITTLGKVLSFRYDSVHTNWILVSSVG